MHIYIRTSTKRYILQDQTCSAENIQFPSNISTYYILLITAEY